MKVSIKSPKKLKNRVFYFPLFLLKTRWSIKLLEEISGSHFKDKVVLRETLKATLKQLKAYKKKNGHFNLVEVHSVDGEDVTVRL